MTFDQFVYLEDVPQPRPVPGSPLDIVIQRLTAKPILAKADKDRRVFVGICPRERHHADRRAWEDWISRGAEYRRHVPEPPPPDTGRQLTITEHGIGGDVRVSCRCGCTPYEIVSAIGLNSGRALNRDGQLPAGVTEADLCEWNPNRDAAIARLNAALLGEDYTGPEPETRRVAKAPVADDRW